jgi:hypothetical protein
MERVRAHTFFELFDSLYLFPFASDQYFDPLIFELTLFKLLFAEIYGDV